MPRGGLARPQLRFALAFGLVAATLFFVYSYPYADGSRAKQLSDAYLCAYARMAGWALSLFEHHVVVTGQNIVGRYSLRIVRGCDAVDAQILLLSAVVASHVHTWRWRVVGALAGTALIAIANVARICSLYYVGLFFPGSFDFCHHELWPLLLVALAAGAFVAWSRADLGAGRGRRAVA
ncbi:MAG TPA: archaeosortase/exosortase family protein [Polyangiaceae bacterium]|nr:archaeosortase/exosortase family protein [Polyangiaceae bacterium]